MERKHPALIAAVIGVKRQALHAGQFRHHGMKQRILMGIDAVKPGLAHIADALPETGDAADVMGAGLYCHAGA